MEYCFCASQFPFLRPRSVKPSLSRRRVRMTAGEKRSESESFRNDLRELLCGDLGSSGRQILAQDLAKRAPSAVDDALRSRGLGGVADFARQLREDILPDVLKNGATYASHARDAVARGPSVSAPPATRLDAESLQQELRNVFNRTPEGVDTPQYAVLARRDGYEIRRYGPMIVARTDMAVDPALRKGESDEVSEGGHAEAMGKSFSTLAGYLFGENENGVAMKMTTPVLLDKGDVNGDGMSFIIGEYGNVDDVPRPSGKVRGNIVIEEMEGGMYASVEFSGFATVGEIRRQRERLREMLRKDEVEFVDDGGYKCVVYNGPTTLPIFRRNEILIPVLSMGVTETETVVEEEEEKREN